MSLKKLDISKEDLSMLRRIVEETRREYAVKYARLDPNVYFSDDGAKERYIQQYFEWVTHPENRGKPISEFGAARFREITGEDRPINKPAEDGGLFTREEIARMLEQG